MTHVLQILSSLLSCPSYLQVGRWGFFPLSHRGNCFYNFCFTKLHRRLWVLDGGPQNKQLYWSVSSPRLLAWSRHLPRGFTGWGLDRASGAAALLQIRGG